MERVERGGEGVARSREMTWERNYAAWPKNVCRRVESTLGVVHFLGKSYRFGVIRLNCFFILDSTLLFWYISTGLEVMIHGTGTIPASVSNAEGFLSGCESVFCVANQYRVPVASPSSLSGDPPIK